jgi:Calcipressin
VRARVYFGEPTPIGEQKKYLDRPDAGRLFFISPPPSPPVGWQVREEGPPNKDVHASDLAEALGKLSGKMEKVDVVEESSPVDRENMAISEATTDPDGCDLKSKPPLHVSAPTNEDASGCKPTSAGGANNVRNRSRSSTVIYDPEAHGDSPALPAVMVEDTTMDDLDDDSGEDDDEAAATLDGAIWEGKKIIAPTARPPVELMENS